MFDALGRDIEFSKTYAFTHAKGGVRTTFIGSVIPSSETCVNMHVCETLCFSMDGFPFENRTWTTHLPREINTTLLFPVDSLHQP